MALTPKVSVVISTYNRPEMLSRALQSVYDQTFRDYEVIVVDDCTPDMEEMRSTLEPWDAAFTGIGVNFYALRLGENSGYQCMPKNKGVEQASGDYIAYLDDDNTWRPDHLASCVDAIEADFSTDMVYTRLCYHADDETAAWYKEKTGEPLPLGEAQGVQWDPALLAHQNYIDTSTILHSKGAFYRLYREDGAGWDESKRRFGDWNFVARWAYYGLNGKLVDKVTVDYNWHRGCLQLTRPAVETPICLNSSQYRVLRRDRQTELAAAS